jgi:hypothetical protein
MSARQSSRNELGEMEVIAFSARCFKDVIIMKTVLAQYMARLVWCLHCEARI